MRHLIAWTILCAACAKGPHTPKDIAGTIPVRIVNYEDSAACELYIQPASDAQAKHDNLLGADYKLDRITSGSAHELSLRAGTYNVGLKGCDATWAAATEQGPLTISGPVEIRIGWTPLKSRTLPPQGFTIENLASIPLGGGGGGNSGNSGGGGGGGDVGPDDPACRPVGAECDQHNDCCRGASCHYVERSNGFGNYCEAF